MQLCGPHKAFTCQCNEVCNPLVSTHDQHQTPSCLNNESILKGVIDFWQKIVYAKLEFQMWHALDYIKGNYPNYGLKLLKICPLEKDLEQKTFLNWKCFQEVLVRTTKIGEFKTMIRLEHMQSRSLH